MLYRSAVLKQMLPFGRVPKLARSKGTIISVIYVPSLWLLRISLVANAGLFHTSPLYTVKKMIQSDFESDIDGHIVEISVTAQIQSGENTYRILNI